MPCKIWVVIKLACLFSEKSPQGTHWLEWRWAWSWRILKWTCDTSSSNCPIMVESLFSWWQWDVDDEEGERRIWCTWFIFAWMRNWCPLSSICQTNKRSNGKQIHWRSNSFCDVKDANLAQVPILNAFVGKVICSTIYLIYIKG